MTDFMDEVTRLSIERTGRSTLRNRTTFLAELAPVTLSTQERDAIKDSFDRWSNRMENLGEPLGFATYVAA